MTPDSPSPALGFIEKSIDLNSHLIKHPAATIFMKTESDHYRKIGIYNGDILVIDRSLTVRNEDYIVYQIDGIYKLGRTDYLAAYFHQNPQIQIIVCGVITNVIHTVKRTPSKRIQNSMIPD